jgi:tetratricopeptide (TPR) repeat protein
VPLAEEQLTWQVEEWLAQARQLMSDPLLGLLQGGLPQGGQSDRPLSGLDLPLSSDQATRDLQTSLSLVNLGQQLYSALFQGTLRDSWVTAQGIAQNRREALRLRLGLKGTRLPRLPWEVMYGNDLPAEKLHQSLSMAARPLAAGTHVIFSRYQPSQRLSDDRLPFDIATDQPLRILMVIAAPDDQERLQLHQEARQLQQELLHPESGSESDNAPDIQLTVLDQPGREQLTQALEQGRYQVLHYAGHSDLSSAGGSLYLVNSRTGLTEILSGDDLAGLLVNNGIRLAVFNSCRGSYTAADPVNERERNLAEALVSRGIPAVLAMAEQIPDNVALTLTWLFYRNLRQGYPIDLSLSRARQGLISAYGSHQLYWALPILYLHPGFDGYLTPGDRTFDNLADRLVLVPQGFGNFPVLTINENVPLPASFSIDDSQPPTDEEMVASAVLAEDDLAGDDLDDWIEDLTVFDDGSGDDEETLDWIRQLTQSSENLTASEGIPLAEDETQPAENSFIEDQPGENPFVENPFVEDPFVENQPEENPFAATPFAENQPPENQSAEYRLLTLFNIVPLEPRPPSSSSVLGSAIALTHDRERTIAQPVRPEIVQVLPIEEQLGSGAEATGALDSQVSMQRSSGFSLRRGLLPVLGAVGAAAIAVLGYSALRSLPSDPVPPVETPSSGEIAPVMQKLEASSTEQVKTIALSSLGKKQLAQGQQAIEVLLNRNAIPEAAAVLAAVPPEYQSEPDIQFLQGRLVWQAVKQGNPAYKLADARIAWEKAAQDQPDSAQYQQALGFAYYAEGDSFKAKQAWEQAIALQQSSLSSPAAPSAAQAEADLQMQMAYAGVALAMRQISVQETPDRQVRISAKAAKVYRSVLTSDPANFTVQALRQNWLWNEAAIQDWQKLSQIES